ncbi:MAG: hypothetical protein DRR08_01360 [Candidatus Parabeggiatoa sp. nov. 2]|nr:MAG: hypothetical protein DRR08_01360 [Gammaproteobacteria bacterium]
MQAIPFYQRLDFVIVGDVFIEAGIAHRQMQRRCD